MTKAQKIVKYGGKMFFHEYQTDEVFWNDGRLMRKLKDKPLLFLSIDYDKNIIQEVKVIKTDSNEADEETNTVAYFVPNKIEEFEPMSADFKATYVWNITRRRGRKTVKLGPGLKSEIANEIREIGGASSQLSGMNSLMSEIEESLGMLENPDEQMYFDRMEPPYDGFFQVRGDFVPTVEYKQPGPKQMDRALRVIEELGDAWDEFREHFNFILHWQLMAPFSFAMRQMGSKYKLGSLYCYGTSRAGKTEMCMLAAHIWDRPRVSMMKSGADVHSVANFGKIISENTFPLLIDEGERMFSKENMAVLEMFKNAVLYTSARSRYNPTTQIHENIPSLSGLMVTSNTAQPSVAATASRMHILEFMRDSIRSKESQAEFNEKFDLENMDGPAKVLGYIGSFVANYIAANPEMLNHSWEESAEYLWQNMYEFAERPQPQWLQKIADPTIDTQDVADDEDMEIVETFEKLVLSYAEIYSSSGSNKNPTTPRTVTTEEKAENVVRGHKADWISLKKPTRGAFAGKEVVEITGGIKHDLRKQFSLEISLRMLSARLQGRYGPARRKDGSLVKVIQWDLEDFLNKFRDDN